MEPQHHRGVPIPLSPKSPWSPEPSSPPCPSPAHQEPSARCGLESKDGRRLFPGAGQASPGPESLTASEGRAWLGWGGGQQEQPQASLFSMAFYSYVILLLTHIGIGAVAHGGGSQRRARTLSEEVQGDRDSGPCLPAQAVSLAKRAPPLGSSPRPAGTGGGAAGSQH